MTVAAIVPWVCSLTSILSVWFSGRKSLWGPAFGVVGVVPWMTFAVSTEAWGLLPVNLVITVLQARCFILWRANAQA